MGLVLIVTFIQTIFHTSVCEENQSLLVSWPTRVDCSYNANVFNDIFKVKSNHLVFDLLMKMNFIMSMLSGKILSIFVFWKFPDPKYDKIIF